MLNTKKVSAFDTQRSKTLGFLRLPSKMLR